MRLGRCTLLTKMFCLMCNMQVLNLSHNKIGDVGLQAFAGALGKGALAQLTQLILAGNQIGDSGVKALADAVSSGALEKLQVSWRPTALFPFPETLHVHSSDSEDLFDVPYAGSWASKQQDC